MKHRCGTCLYKSLSLDIDMHKPMWCENISCINSKQTMKEED